MATTSITICSDAHFDVWKLTSQLLIENLEADNYLLYVPARSISKFSQNIPAEFEVISQESLDCGYINILKNRLLQCNNLDRLGWYAQQFHKIQAMTNCESEKMIIWDADCVPLRPISLFNDYNQPIYMESSYETYQPYFDYIERLLKLEKVVPFSFVVPGFPMRQEWLDIFIKELESLASERSWFEVLIENIDFSLRSGFSETEILGTWSVNHYPNSWELCNYKWERRGQNKFGYARNLSIGRIRQIGKYMGIDVASFENWDLRGFAFYRKRLMEKLNIR